MNYTSAKRDLWVDYCYMIMIVIYAGSASDFVYSLTTWTNPVGLLIPIVSTMYLAYVRKISFSNAFIFLILGFLIYFVASTLKFRELHPRFLAAYLIFFFISYVILNAFKQRFFIMYVKIIYYLCIVSVFFWIVQVIAPDVLRQILTPLTVTSPGEEHINIIVYTIEKQNITNRFLIPRNSGFAWEPGVFATYINLAIFSLLITNKFKVFKDLKFWVLVGALITTMSTTGYSILLILVAFYGYNQKAKYIVAIVPLFLLLVAYVSTLPFMAEKLVEVSSFNTRELIYNSVKWGSAYNPQRLQSFQIDFIDFVNNPIIGYGGHNETTWTAKLGAEINTVSGIGNLLAQFGTVGALFFFYQLLKTSKDSANSFGYKGGFSLFIIMMMISISYALFTPLFMCFWLMRSNFLPRMELLKFKAYSYLFALYK